MQFKIKENKEKHSNFDYVGDFPRNHPPFPLAKYAPVSI